MGTRADFYVGRGEDAEWLGSIAWDGYPEGIAPEKNDWPAGGHLFDAATEQEYRERVDLFFQHREDVSRPADGWPWPWDDSNTTDYAYAFDAGRVFASCFGRDWRDSRDKRDEDEGEEPETFGAPTFPNMKERKNVQWGAKSGVMVLGIPHTS